MNTKQLAEMSLIAGNLEGVANILEMIDDIDPKRFQTTIKDIKNRILVLRDEFTTEFLESEKSKKTDSKPSKKSPIKKTEEKQK